MTKLNLALITCVCLIVAAPVAMADKRPEAAERQQAVEHQREVQRMKQRDQESEQERRNQADKDREQARVRAHEQAKEEQGLDGVIDENQQRGDAHGNEQAEEMRAHRDERMAIKEEYDADRASGDEGADRELDAADRDEEHKEKAKKPWWKFWGD